MNNNLIFKNVTEYWNRVFSTISNDKVSVSANLSVLAPSKKLYDAVSFLSICHKLLDYGCGNGWASIIAAKSGCKSVTAVDTSAEAIKLVRRHSKAYKIDSITVANIDPDWLETVQEGAYDGFFCSNVIDVVPLEIAEEIIKQSYRVTTPDARVIISMNYYLSKEEADKRNMNMDDDGQVFVDGVMRLLSRSDQQWIELFSPYYEVEKLEYFSWPNETVERRRLFHLRKKVL